MLKLYIIAFLLVGCSAFSFKLKDGDDECCDTKTVGDVTYKLVGKMDTSSYDCISNCVYQPVGGNSSSSFCFKGGNLPVTCKDNYCLEFVDCNCDCDTPECCDCCSHCPPCKDNYCSEFVDCSSCDCDTDECCECCTAHCP